VLAIMLGIGGGDIPLELASDPDNMKKIIYICIVKNLKRNKN